MKRSRSNSGEDSREPPVKRHEGAEFDFGLEGLADTDDAWLLDIIHDNPNENMTVEEEQDLCRYAEAFSQDQKQLVSEDLTAAEEEDLYQYAAALSQEMKQKKNDDNMTADEELDLFQYAEAFSQELREQQQLDSSFEDDREAMDQAMDLAMISPLPPTPQPQEQLLQVAADDQQQQQEGHLITKCWPLMNNRKIIFESVML